MGTHPDDKSAASTVDLLNVEEIRRLHLKAVLSEVLVQYHECVKDNILGPAAYGLAVTTVAKELEVSVASAALLFGKMLEQEVTTK